AFVACRFDSCPFRHVRTTCGSGWALSSEASPNGMANGLLTRHALRVQVQLLPPPPKFDGDRVTVLVAVCATRSPPEESGPVAQGNESATLRRSRSHVQIAPGPPINKSYGVAELERREFLKLV